MKRSIYYIGSSDEGLKLLVHSPFFKVIKAFCLEKRLTDKLKNTAKELKIQLVAFEWHKDFKEIILNLDKTIPFFIYQLDMLVPEDLTRLYDFYNVHRGCLKTNRGPNPDVWPFLLGKDKTAISLHKINEKIDAGVLISSKEIKIDDNDNSYTIKLKLEQQLPCLINALYEYLSGSLKGEVVLNGKYYPWITEDDFTISNQDDYYTIQKKIKSQGLYYGAIIKVQDKKYYVQNVKKLPDSFKKGKPSIKVVNNKIIWETKNMLLEFEININAHYKPMPSKKLPSNRI